jgi:hypothetical protein
MKIFLVLLSAVAFSQAQNLPNVRLNFFGASLTDTQNIDLSNAATAFSQLSTSYFDSSKKNFIFVMGWQPADSSGTLNEVISAYLDTKRSQFNVINLDWSAYAASIDYIGVVNSLNSVSATANQVLSQISSQGFDMTKTHIAGFSFGALIAGAIGRYFKGQGATLPRITGLEPPEFYGGLTLALATAGVTKLSASDAKFVDNIHTSVGSFGDFLTRGHVDFWPNGGSSQPGCGSSEQTSTMFSSWNNFIATVGCNHGRSYMYYAESVRRNSSAPGFISKRCSWWALLSFDPSSCSISSSTSMGFYADVTTSGPFPQKFYVATANSSPYSLS